MSNGSEIKSRSAQRLRQLGFVPLPRWWVTPDQLEVIRRMAHGHQDTINEVRAEYRGEHDPART